jgi:hypothetical protein
MQRHNSHISIDEAIVSHQNPPCWSDKATQFPDKKQITVDAAIVSLQNPPIRSDAAIVSLLKFVKKRSLFTSSTNRFTHLPPSKDGLKLGCNVNILYGNLKSENSQVYAQKPQRNCMFIRNQEPLSDSRFWEIELGSETIITE